MLTDPETADGFRLAGVDVLEAETVEQAKMQITELLDNPDSGIIGVNESFYMALDEKTLERIESVYRPIVIPLPIKETLEGIGERKAYLSRLIHRAIGIDITLRGSEEG